MSQGQGSALDMPRVHKLIAAAALSGTAALLTPALASAADFEVNSLADTDDGSCLPLGAGNCTLREALDAADGSPGSIPNDTITFASGLSGTIDLTADLPTVNNYPVDVLGPGPSNLTIDGNGAFRAFRFSAVPGGASTIDGLNMIDGYGDKGGTIRATESGGVTVSNSAISGSVGRAPHLRPARRGKRG